MNESIHERRKFRRGGFTLIELLVVVAITAVLSTIAAIAANTTIKRGRDTRRKTDLSQVGHFLASGCFIPSTGPGEYDLATVMGEIKTTHAQNAEFFTAVPLDPHGGTPTDSGYDYILSSDGKRCALVANLENTREKITLPGLSDPTPGAGIGVVHGSARGRNGTDIYFQVSN